MIICYHRQIEDWSKKKSIEPIRIMLNPEEFKSITINKNKWDKKFKLSFFDFRHRIQQIHLENIRNAGMIEINNFDHLFDVIENDDIIVPSDDDDWFNPHIGDHLQKAITNSVLERVMVWDCYSLNFSSKRVYVQKYERREHVLSCGYAFSGAFLKKLYNFNGRDFVYMLLQYHWRVKDMILKTKYVDGVLSFYNYHCGSVSQLRHEDYKLPNTTSYLPKSPHNWTKQYIVKLYQLYEESGLFKHKLT